MDKQWYIAPETEIILIRQEKGFLGDSELAGRADRGYEDNEMEGL
jgi:hypothetical protein